MSESDVIVEVEKLDKSYGKGLFKKGTQALDQVSLRIGRGTVFGLLGPNGAGKTTLIKVLLGLVKPGPGKALVFGEPVGRAFPRRRVGYLPEAHRMPYYLTGWQVLELYGMLCGRPKSWLTPRIPTWLEKVGMAKDAHRKVREYSKGMQQRIGLAQALVHEPELIFLDEPTDGVDPVGRRAIRKIVEELKGGGATVFINSHLLMEVEQICDRAVIMDKGRIIREGTIDELRQSTGTVRFSIDPLPADLESLLEGLGEGFALRDNSSFDLKTTDEEMDAVVDRLRARSIGIRSIQPQKLSLEEAFIEQVQGSRQEGAA